MHRPTGKLNALTGQIRELENTLDEILDIITHFSPKRVSALQKNRADNIRKHIKEIEECQ